MGSFKNLLVQNHCQNRSYLHESFQIKCRYRTVHIMVPEGWVGPQLGKPYLHVFILRTSRQTSIKVGINHPCVKGILNCSNKVPGPFQRGDNCKNWVGSFKNLQNHWARIGHIYMKAFWYNVDSELFISWSPGVRRGHSRENHIHLCLCWEKNLLQNQQANFNQSWYKSYLGKGNFNK
jgi:hypothetical protein